jgi:hypothetical protein
VQEPVPPCGTLLCRCLAIFISILSNFLSILKPHFFELPIGRVPSKSDIRLAPAGWPSLQATCVCRNNTRPDYSWRVSGVSRMVNPLNNLQMDSSVEIHNPLSKQRSVICPSLFLFKGLYCSASEGAVG